MLHPLHELDRDEAVKAVRERLLEDVGQGDKLALDYAYYYLDGDEEFDPACPEYREDFEDFVHWKAVERLDEELERLEGEVVREADGRLRLWRALVVPDDWIETEMATRPIGVCWAFDPEFAQPHHGYGSGEPGRMIVRVEALVEPCAVDWLETVVLNAAAPYTVGDEKEIRLLPGSLVTLSKVEKAHRKGSFGPAAASLGGLGPLLAVEALPPASPGFVA